MKRLLLLLLLFPLQLYAQAPATCTDKNGNPCPGAGHPFTFITNTGNLSDVQGTVNDSTCLDGDTIRIGPSPTPGTQTTYTWSGSWTNVVSTTPKIVKLLGWGKHKTRLQRGNSTFVGMIHYTCKDTTTIAEVGLLNLDNSVNPKTGAKNLWVDGVATLKRDPNATATGGYVGGIKIHDILFTSDLEHPGAAGPATHYLVHGWVFGVMYHCEMADNIYKGAPTGECNSTGEIGEFMHATDPSGNSSNSNRGDYVTSFPADGSELAGTPNLFYIEDCIWHHGGGWVDSNNVSAGTGGYGGALRCDRHDTWYGDSAVHGSREGGSAERNTRLVEEYNNHKVHFHDTVKAPVACGREGYTQYEARDGEHIGYNNYISNVAPTQKPNDSDAGLWAGISIINYNCIADDRWLWSADGLNPWDNNEQRSSFDMVGPISGIGPFHHDVDVNYTYHSSVTGDQVTNGVDQETYHRYGSVYGHATSVTVPSYGFGPANPSGGIPYTGNQTAINTVNAQAWDASANGGAGGLKGTSTNPFPKDFFRGFMIRNADVPRSQGSANKGKGMCYMYIVSSTATSGGTPTTVGTINLTVNQSNGNNNDHPNLDPTAVGGGHFEFRRVLNIYNAGDPAQSDRPIKTDGSGNPYVNDVEPRIVWTNQHSRFVVWGNRWRNSTSQTVIPPSSAWGLETIIDRFTTQAGEFIITGAQQLRGDATTFHIGGSADATQIHLGTDGTNQYNWNPSATIGSAGPDGKIGYVGTGTSGETTTGNLGPEEQETTAPCDDLHPETRIGADFIQSVPRPSWLAAGGYTGVDATTGLWGPFFMQGAGGFTYPHPLRGGGSMTIPSSAPTFTNPSENTSWYNNQWKPGQVNTFTVNVMGIPVPTITKTGGPTLPSWLTFTANTNGTATFTTTSGAVAGTIGTFPLSATNSAGTTTQNLTLTVGTAVTISLSCSLVSPVSGGAPYVPGVDTIPLEATAVPSTGHSISGVSFFQSGSPPTTYTLIGAGTFDSTSQSWKGSWTAPSAGNYSVKATATETPGGATADSSVATITSSPTPTPTPIPSPATIIVKP